MRASENLVKQLARQRNAALDAELKGQLREVKEKYLWRELPPGVQQRFEAIAAHKEHIAKLQKEIEAAGFDDDLYGQVCGKDDGRYTYPHPRSKQREEIGERINARRAQISALLNTALIDLIGLDAKEARPIVHAFRTALQKV